MSLLETQVREIHKRIPEMERDRDSLRSERDALKEDYERLKRTIEHMEHEYLKAHGGNWGDCKYQVKLDVLKAERDKLKAKTGACQHEGRAAELDCDRPAVLCVDHGGHDGCAVDQMRVDALLREVALCGVEHQTRKYVVVQIDHETWNTIQTRYGGEGR